MKHNEAAWIDFNINETVRVQLTDAGPSSFSREWASNSFFTSLCFIGFLGYFFLFKNCRTDRKGGCFAPPHQFTQILSFATLKEAVWVK